MKNTGTFFLNRPAPKMKARRILWSFRTLSTMACAAIIGYAVFYGTNMLEIPAVTVGLLIMASKIFDAFTDIAGGVLIDRTASKWGKGRPFELSIIALWISTILMFSCPNFGLTGKCIWLFIWYTVVNDVFFTLLNVAEPVYMMGAFPERKDMEVAASLNGMFGLIGMTFVMIVYPILMSTIGQTKAGWPIMALIFGIPMTLVGMLRILLVPEIKEVKAEKKEQLTTKDVIRSFTSNRYIWLYLIIILIINMLNNLSSTMTYYFTYIVKNQAAMSLANLPLLVSPVLLLLFPIFLKKYSVVKVSIVCLIIGIIGNVLKHFAGANIPFIVAATFLGNIATLPISFMVVLLTDTVEYNEYKTGIRIEGLYSSVGSFGQKVGMALASGLSGLLLSASGFISSNTATQPDSAITMIRWMFGLVPAIFLTVALIAYLFFDIEKKMPGLREQAELESANV